MTKPTRPVLRYHGGKWILVPWIIRHMPESEIYVEEFGGAGSVLMRKPRCKNEVYNDLGAYVFNVFKVMRDPEKSKRLQELLMFTPFARDEYNLCNQEGYENETDDVERARMTIVRSFMGFGSGSINHKYSTGFRANSHRNGLGAAKDWNNYPMHIPAFTERLQGVIIENKNYSEVALQNDSKNTLHYLDPPYLLSTRKSHNNVYEFEMAESEHKAMADVAKSLKGMVVVSGYRSQLYDKLFKSWHRVETETLGDGACKRIECLWMNRSAHKKQGQFKLFAP